MKVNAYAAETVWQVFKMVAVHDGGRDAIYFFSIYAEVCGRTTGCQRGFDIMKTALHICEGK